MFWKGHLQGTLLLFRFDTALQITLIKYLLPEITSGIDEKVTEENVDQNFSNVKFLITHAAHMLMTPPFFIIVWRFWAFFDDFHDAISRY